MLIRPATVLLLVLGCCALAYWPGLTGGYMFDDTHNLMANADLKAVVGWDWQAIWDATWSGYAGALKRPVSMFTFALNHAATGMAPWPMKLTNLLIHLATGLAFYVYASALAQTLADRRRLTSSVARWLPVLTVALWLLHPLQLTSVLYVVQRMASLSTFFVACGLAVYAWGRLRQDRGQRGIVGVGLAWLLFLPLAAFTKENGVLLSPLLLLTEYVFFRCSGLDRSGRRALTAGHLLFCVIPAVIVLGYLIVHPQWFLAGYANREFDLQERLLTQARALWFYVGLLALPRQGRMGLYHDDFEISTSLLQPWTTLPAVLALLVAVIVAAVRLKRWPIFGYAVFFYLIGHLVESTALALEIMHEHRNYLPSFGLAFGASYVVLYLWEHARGVRFGIAMLASAFVISLGALTALRAHAWGNDLERALMEAHHHPKSPRALSDAAAMLGGMALGAADSHALLRKARELYSQARELESIAINSSLGFLVASNRLGEPLDADALDALEEKLVSPPLAAATPDAIVALVECQRAGNCTFEVDTVMRLAHAVVSNPQIRPVARSRIQTIMGQYFIDMDDYQTAGAYLQDAYLSNKKDPQTAMNLADLLMSLGEYSESRRLLDEIGERDLTILHRQRWGLLDQKWHSNAGRHGEVRATPSPKTALGLKE